MRSGGSTTIDKDGKVIAEEAPTADHPEGNRARPAAEPKAAGDGQEAAPRDGEAPDAARRKRVKE